MGKCQVEKDGQSLSSTRLSHRFVLRSESRIDQRCGEASISETNSRLGESILMNAHVVAITLRLICTMMSRCADDEVEENSIPPFLMFVDCMRRS